MAWIFISGRTGHPAHHGDEGGVRQGEGVGGHQPWHEHHGKHRVSGDQAVTKRCHLSWLTNSALVYEPLCRGGGGLRDLSQWEQLCTWSPNKLWRSYSIFNIWKWQSCGCASFCRMRLLNVAEYPVLRIRDVYPGSRILIFTHPGSRIPDPKKATKERGEK